MDIVTKLVTRQASEGLPSPVWSLPACRQSGDNDDMVDLKGKFPNGLAVAMAKKGIGPTELARVAGTSKQNIDRWSAQSRKLPVDWAERLAPLLDSTREQLVFAKTPRVAKKALKELSPSVLHVPVLDKVAAGKLRAPSSQIPAEDVPLLAFADLGRGEFFGLTVEGDSMDRISPDGSTIVVNRADRALVSGKPYVFSHRGEASFKLWRPEPPRFAPYSNNPMHEPVYVKSKAEAEKMVVGRVKRTVLDL